MKKHHKNICDACPGEISRFVRFVMLSTSLGRLRLIGLLEGLSFLVLVLIAMPLKYFVGEPLAVRYVGMAHGILFLGYLLALVPVALDYRWKLSTCALGVLASLLPGGPFVFDARILKPLLKVSPSTATKS